MLEWPRSGVKRWWICSTNLIVLDAVHTLRPTLNGRPLFRRLHRKALEEHLNAMAAIADDAAKVGRRVEARAREELTKRP